MESRQPHERRNDVPKPDHSDANFGQERVAEPVVAEPVVAEPAVAEPAVAEPVAEQALVAVLVVAELQHELPLEPLEQLPTCKDLGRVESWKNRRPGSGGEYDSNHSQEHVLYEP